MLREALLLVGWLDPLGLGTFLSLTAAFLLFLFVRHVREMKTVARFNQKAILITGCDSGLGRAYALHLDKEACHVFAGCLSQSSVDALKGLEEVGPKFHPFLLDVSSEESLATAAAEVEAELGRRGLSGLWAFVTNAGVRQASVPDEWITNIRPYSAVFDVNLLGTIRTVQAFRPLLRRNPEGGRIVLIESMYAIGASAFQAAGPYILSKKAVDAYADLLRKECRWLGLSVHGILPGFYATRVASAAVATREAEELWFSLPPPLKASYGPGFRDWFTKTTTRSIAALTESRMHEPVWAVYHAVAAAHPRDKYYVSWVVKAFYLLHLLPLHFQDAIEAAILKHVLGMPTPGPIPAAT